MKKKQKTSLIVIYDIIWKQIDSYSYWENTQQTTKSSMYKKNKYKTSAVWSLAKASEHSSDNLATSAAKLDFSVVARSNC